MGWFKLILVIIGIAAIVFGFLQIKYFVQNQDILMASGNMTTEKWLGQNMINVLWMTGGFILVGVVIGLSIRKKS